MKTKILTIIFIATLVLGTLAYSNRISKINNGEMTIESNIERDR